MFNTFLLIGDNIFFKILKTFVFETLDTFIYWLVGLVYQIFHSLANATILDEVIVKNFTNRVYAIIGVIMVFVIAFSLLNYIVDPDKITDKKVGASSVIKDIVIALVILTILPNVFLKLYSFQDKILSSGVISNIILGGYDSKDAPGYKDYEENKADKGYSSLADYYNKNGANVMIANTFSAFMYPANESTVLGCDPNNVVPEDQRPPKEYCDAYTRIKMTGKIKEYEYLYTRDDYKYIPIISTAAGIALLFFMLSFCINLAKRVGKLALLQLIAPIPVILEILPNKKGTRKVWVEQTVKTYLEVFIFLGVIYSTVFLISLLPKTALALMDNASGNSFFGLILIIILMFGLLQFAKEAPKMIIDLLGIKDSGTIGTAFKRSGIMAAVAARTTQSTIGNAMRGWNENKGVGRFTGAAAAAGSAFTRNLWAGRNAHSLGDANKNRMSINEGISTRRINRQAYNYTHGGFVGAIKGHAKDFLRDQNKSFNDATSIAVGYRKKREMERAFAELGKKKKNIMDIITKDAQYQQLRSAWINGGKDTSPNNKVYKAMTDRAEDVFKAHQDEYRVVLGEYKGIIGSNQNVDGMWNLNQVNRNLDYNNLNNFDQIFSFNNPKGDGDLEFKKGSAINDSADGNDVVLDITNSTGRTVYVRGKAKDVLKQDYGYRETKANETIDENVRRTAQETLKNRKEDNKK